MDPVSPAADSVEIASSGSLSAATALGKRSLFAIEMPAAWTTAALSFAVSRDGSTFVPLSDQDGEFVIASDVAVASVGLAVDPVLFAGWTHVKVRSGTAGSPVAQAGARVIGLGLRESL